MGKFISHAMMGIVFVLVVLMLAAEAGRDGTQRTRKMRITRTTRTLKKGRGITKAPTRAPIPWPIPGPGELSVPYSKHPEHLRSWRGHNVDYSSRKKALEGAENSSPSGARKPVHDVAHKPGQKNHFHTVDRNGERLGDNVHHRYGRKNALGRGISPQPYQTTTRRPRK